MTIITRESLSQAVSKCYGLIAGAHGWEGAAPYFTATATGDASGRRDIRATVGKALAVKRRGAILQDTLELVRCTGWLNVEWCARRIHPWDCNFPMEQQAQTFLQLAMEDTESVAWRLFSTLPTELPAIAVRVLDPADRAKVLLAGTVERDDLSSASRSRSLKMRLRMLGIQVAEVSSAEIIGLDAL